MTLTVDDTNVAPSPNPGHHHGSEQLVSVGDLLLQQTAAREKGGGGAGAAVPTAAATGGGGGGSWFRKDKRSRQAGAAQTSPPRTHAGPQRGGHDADEATPDCDLESVGSSASVVDSVQSLGHITSSYTLTPGGSPASSTPSTPNARTRGATSTPRRIPRDRDRGRGRASPARPLQYVVDGMDSELLESLLGTTQ